MDESPNTNPAKWTMSYSYSQPYTAWNHPASSVEKEIAVLDAIDNIVQHMLTYPEAEAILNTVMNQGGRNV